jgi:hypothetical protein
VLLHASSNAWTAVAVPAGTPVQLALAVAAEWLLVLAVVAVWGPGLVRSPSGSGSGPSSVGRPAG